MASLFISHSSVDRALVEALRDWLVAQGYAALFVDFDPQLGIPAGRNWERELYSQLRKADGVLLVLTVDAAKSQWCFAEVSLARSLRKPVVTLRTDPAARMALVDDAQGVDFDGDAASFAELKTRLAHAGLGSERSFEWAPGRRPYPGLSPFSPEDAAVFFGRDEEVARLLEMLEPTLQRGPGRFVAIVGPSGSGKSSLLHAGLIPRLRRRPDRWLVLPPLLPGQWPSENLARCLRQALRAAGIDQSVDDLKSALANRPSVLVEIVQELAGVAGHRTVLLPIDQAEELITRAGPEEQQAFLQLIDTSLARAPELWVVATLRSEFLSNDATRVGIADVIDDTLLMEPLSRERLPAVILGPAQLAGIDFEPGLVERMVLDAGRGDALSLLQVTLHALHEGVGADATVTATDYERVGGVGGALRQRANLVLGELIRRGVDDAVVPLLLRLMVVERDGQPTSRRLPRSALSTTEQLVADAFIDARLLTAARDGDGATIAIAHEALVRSWPVAAEAIRQARETLRLRSELERYAADWRSGDYDDAYLLRGGRLALYEKLEDDSRHVIGDLARDYLQASRAHVAKQLRAARRSNRRLRMLVTGLTFAVVLVAVAGVLAIARGREAQRQASLAAARLLSARADGVVDGEPDLAVALGLQSLKLAKAGAPPEGLVAGLAHIAHPTRIVARSNDQIHAVGFTPDGRLLAHAGWNRAVSLVDPVSGAAVGMPMTGHTAAIMTMAVSPDGSRIATGSDDGEVRLWELRTRRQQGPPLRGHDAGVSAVAFAPDGRRLASADVGGTVLLWDVATGARDGPPLAFGSQVQALAFSPDGRTLAVGREREIRLWKVGAHVGASDAIVIPGRAQGIAFRPDGSAIAAGTVEGANRTDGGVYVWALPSRTPVPIPDLHELEVRTVAYSRDGRLLASAGDDGTVQLYDATSLQPYPQPLEGHTNAIKSIAFSSDGRRIASGSWDRTVRVSATAPVYSVRRPLSAQSRAVSDVAVSDLGLSASTDDHGLIVFHDARGRRVGPPLAAHRAPIAAISFSADGAFVTTGADDGSAGVWDVVRRRMVGEEITTGFSGVLDVALHPDRTQLAVGGWMGSGDWQGAKVFDLRSSGTPSIDIRGHVEAVEAVAYSPDGAYLATAGGDQRVILHRAGRARRVLRDHGGAARDVAFSPTGDRFASVGDDGTVAVYDLPSARRRRLIRTQRGALAAVTFSLDGRRIAAGGSDGTAWVWSAETGDQIGFALSGHREAITSIAFTPRDDEVMTAGDGLWIWDIGFDRWGDVGCRVANRNLGMAEWAELLPDRPYERTCPEAPAGGWRRDGA